MVLVILAILAAMLVPALLGWIDEAKKKQYVLEARNIYIAAQAVADEAYANSKDNELSVDILSEEGDYTRLKELADLTAAPDIEGIYLKESYNLTSKDNRKAAFTLVGMAVKFKAADGKNIAARLVDNEWDVAIGSSDDANDATMPKEPSGYTGVWKAAE